MNRTRLISPTFLLVVSGCNRGPNQLNAPPSLHLASSGVFRGILATTFAERLDGGTDAALAAGVVMPSEALGPHPHDRPGPHRVDRVAVEIPLSARSTPVRGVRAVPGQFPWVGWWSEVACETAGPLGASEVAP